MLLLNASIVILFSGCASAPKIELCGVINSKVAECNPTDPKQSSYDKDLEDMVGYTCISPRDAGNLKKYIRRLLEELK